MRPRSPPLLGCLAAIGVAIAAAQASASPVRDPLADVRPTHAAAPPPRVFDALRAAGRIGPDRTGDVWPGLGLPVAALSRFADPPGRPPLIATIVPRPVAGGDPRLLPLALSSSVQMLAIGLGALVIFRRKGKSAR